MHQNRVDSLYKTFSNYLRQYLLVAILASFFLFQVIKFVKLSILDFDGHHDAYVLASAIGVSEGRVLYRDIFWQYGPLQPYLLAVLIKALPFFSPLMVARLTGLALVLLTFLVAILQPSLRTSKPNRIFEIKLITLIIFLGLQDSYYGVPFLFWPNHLLIVFIALSVNQLVRQIQKPNEHKNSSYALQGLYLALITLTRPQFFLIGPLLVALIAIYLRSRNEKSKIKFLLVGFIFPLLIVTVTMTRNHVFKDFIEQTFVWPRAAYDSDVIKNFYQILSEVVISNLLLVALMFVLMAESIFNFLGPLRQKVLLFLVVSYCTFKVLYGTISIWTAANVVPARISIVHLEIAILVAFILCGFYLVFNFFVTVFTKKANNNSSMLRLMVASMAGFSIAQAFPVFDTRHTNLAILGLVPLVIAFLLGTRKSFQHVYVVFGLVLIFGIFTETQRTSSSYERLARVQGEKSFVDGGVSTLMPNDSRSISTRRSSSLRMEFLFLESVLKNDERAIFLSEDAAFSIFDGTWRSVDQWFVNWGPVPKLPTRIIDGQFPLIVMDELTVSKSERYFVSSSGYEYVDRKGRLSIYRMQE
jgi:hypothetical protein